jgi:uncharacterized protein (DUF1778 family)
MSPSLRIPPEKEKLIEMAARKEGKTRSAFILEAIDEKLGMTSSREQLIRDLAGWLSHEDAEDLRKSVAVFDRIYNCAIWP